jgi:acyl-CoA thioesterase II
VPFVYTVRHIRDGGAYCTRAVDARQKDQICFTAICSFKRPEKHGAEHYHHHQPPAPLTKENDRYNAVLLDPKTGKLRSPEESPLAPGVDSPWYIEGVESGDIKETEFPGTDVRKVDMTSYNETDEVKTNPHKYRQLQWYRIKDASEGNQDGSTQNDKSTTFLKSSLEDGEYDNLFACAHLYTSDKNSLFIIPRAVGEPDGWNTITSLSITVIFHQHGESIRMLEPDSADRMDKGLKKKWFLHESSTARSGENRGLFEQHVWTQDGTLLATVMQDSLVRYGDPPGAKL